MTRLPVSAVAAQRVVTFLHEYSLAHGLSIPDALIAVIARDREHTLVTSNLHHFRCIAGLRLEPAPYRLPQSADAPQ